LALSACATAPVSYGVSVPLRPPPGPPSVTIYTGAPHAALQSELIACNLYGHNLGPLGARSESLLYSPYIDTPAGMLLRDPTEHACLSSGFGWRGTADGGGSNHTGIDLASANGGVIYAAGDGWIAAAEQRGGYGLVLEIDHGHGVRTLYGHLSEIDPNLAPGMHVAAGAPVARMGMTGNATGVHLHYEVTIDGLKVDPLAYASPYVAPAATVVTIGQEPMQPVERGSTDNGWAAPAQDQKR
jgi:murein DD-endopeptidase MepM/ murein hydrolase activator NlpD